MNLHSRIEGDGQPRTGDNDAQSEHIVEQKQPLSRVVLAWALLIAVALLGWLSALLWAGMRVAIWLLS
jgi:hypothetical protein